MGNLSTKLNAPAIVADGKSYILLLEHFRVCAESAVAQGAFDSVEELLDAVARRYCVWISERAETVTRPYLWLRFALVVHALHPLAFRATFATSGGKSAHLPALEDLLPRFWSDTAPTSVTPAALVAELSIAPAAERAATIGFDFVGSAQGQLRFLERLALDGFVATSMPSDSVLALCVADFRRFLCVRANARKSRTCVPTLLIDWAWHAAMLRPSAYERVCERALGYVMDHDDSLPDEHLRDAFAETAALYRVMFGQRYDCSIADIHNERTRWQTPCVGIWEEHLANRLASPRYLHESGHGGGTCGGGGCGDGGGCGGGGCGS